MAEYLLLLREQDVDLIAYTDNDLKELFGKFVSWSQELEKQGCLSGVARRKGENREA